MVWIDWVDPPTGLGLTLKRSMFSRAGELTWAIGAVPLPAGHPVVGFTGGFVAAVTTAVGTDEAKLLPSAFVACTLKRIVFPTSTF